MSVIDGVRILIAIVLWMVLVAIAVARSSIRDPAIGGGRRLDAAFWGVLAIALPVWRLWPLLYNGELNVDESQVLAQAMRFGIDPVPWRSVVGGSSGPLNTWIVMWAPLFGLPYSYLPARITSLACILVTLHATAWTAGRICSKRLSLLLTLPAATLMLTTLNPDFLHLASEMLPSAMLACLVALVWKRRSPPPAWHSFAIGVVAGALPFTKLQVAPAAVVLFGYAAASLVWRRGLTASTADMFRLLCGGVMVPTLILGPVVTAGAWEDFMTFYLRYGATYNTARILDIPPWRLVIAGSREFSAFWIPLTLGLTTGALLNWLRQHRQGWLPFVALLPIFGYAALMLLLATWTRMGLPHYLILLLGPFTLTCAAVARLGTAGDRMRGRTVVAVVAITLLIQVAMFLSEAFRKPRMLSHWGIAGHAVADEAKRLSATDDTLFVWGWAPKFHVMSGLPPATRFAVNTTPVGEGTAATLYIRRTLEDLAVSKPRVILDATDEFIGDNRVKGLAATYLSLPALAALIERDYSLVMKAELDEARLPYLVFLHTRGSGSGR
jgi:hypothetical protein